MRTARKTGTSIMVLLLAATGCSQQIEDPVFDYNLKSAEVIETNNRFGLELLKTVMEDEDSPNLMISPASVSIALGMTYNGAEQETRAAFEEVLNYEGLTREEVNEITRELINVLVTNVDGNLLEIANSIWYRQGFQVKGDFVDRNRNYFDAEVRELDFAGAQAIETINDWVSQKTHGRIDEIINQIDPAVMMILINALYFNCLWEYEFDPENTRNETFRTSSGEPHGQVDMMELESTLNVSFTEEYGAVELPYKNEKFSMYLFLPSPGTSVMELVSGLDGNSWSRWLDGFGEVNDFRVYLPKFKFEFQRSLADDLRAMGLDIAFTSRADFSGISDTPLLISDVIHKTYIDVNEEGTEAAAVTAVVMELTSVGPPKELRLNRPFLFAITENSSKSILFIGRVAEPSYTP